jgi:acylglycerol lipase
VKKPKGVIVIMHGLNAHSGLYAHLAQNLSQNGYDCVAFDQLGFGKSEARQRGFIENNHV